MDPDVQAQSPDKSDVKASFRKPANEVANRKYRRHSPVAKLDSSSSDGTPKRDRSHSPVFAMNDRNKMSDDCRRKDDGRQSERELNHYRSSRGSESYRHSERSYGNSQDYRRHNDSGRYTRHAEEEERSYQWSSRSGRESRTGTYDNPRHENSSSRYRENLRDAGKNTRDRSENWGHRHKDKEIETTSSEHYRHKGKGSDKAKFVDYEKPVLVSKQNSSSRDDVKSGERERPRDQDARDVGKDRRRSPDYKNDHAASDSVLGRGSNAQSKESQKNSNKDMDWKKEDSVQRRKNDDKELNNHKDKNVKDVDEELPRKSSIVSSYHEREGRKERQIESSYIDENSSSKKLKLGRSGFDEMPTSGSKQVADTAEIITSKPLNSVSNQAESANGVDAAKFAAMKAAELVNKNIVGGGYLSTDQKKKLLWGGKKSTAAEETGKRWDLQLFADQERQEKFNKLMSLRLPWYLWPIVGCEGRICFGAQIRRQGCREAEGNTQHGPGEAIHCWTAAKRWSNSGPWPVIILTCLPKCFVIKGVPKSCYKCLDALVIFLRKNLVLKHFMLLLKLCTSPAFALFKLLSITWIIMGAFGRLAFPSPGWVWSTGMGQKSASVGPSLMCSLWIC